MWRLLSWSTDEGICYHHMPNRQPLPSTGERAFKTSWSQKSHPQFCFLSVYQSTQILWALEVDAHSPVSRHVYNRHRMTWWMVQIHREDVNFKSSIPTKKPLAQRQMGILLLLKTCRLSGDLTQCEVGSGKALSVKQAKYGQRLLRGGIIRYKLLVQWSFACFYFATRNKKTCAMQERRACVEPWW